MSDDFSVDTETIGTVDVGGSATGNIETSEDQDWFAVELVAGHTYRFDLEGSPTGAGTLSDTYLRGIHDSEGTRISGTRDDDDGVGRNSRIEFTAAESGTYYVSAGAYGRNTGTYTLRVTDRTDVAVLPEASDFSADTSTAGKIAVEGTATGGIGTSGDRDWFAVELVAGRNYTIDLRGSPTGDGTLRDPYLRGVHDAEGNLIANTRNDDGGESVNSRVTLTATETGTHYIAAGAYTGHRGTYTLEVTDNSPPSVEPPAEEPSQQEPPAFGAQSYAFTLAENADGSTDRVSLGSVAASDPEGATVAYSIVGGNAAGLFEIDAASGELFYTGSGEDFESATNSFSLTIRASDGSLDVDTTVAVNVTSVAEAPAFNAQSYAFTLAENADGSTNRVALGMVSATDPETTSLIYSIEGGNAAGLFEIEALTGALSYKGGGEDYESGTTSYELTVRASDGGLHSDVTVTVNVTDVEEQTEPDPLNSQEQQAAVQETVSEPDGEDFSADNSSQGRVSVGGVARGEIGTSGDRDWFAVDLVAGHTYVIDLRGRQTGDGTLSDPHLRGIHDAAGNLISGTTNDDGGEGRNSRLTFTASESGTYYIAAGAHSSRQGTYEVEVVEDDFAQSTETTGTVEVGGTATGEIQRASDRDWFAVELEADKTYQIDLSGLRSGGGTLNLPHLRGVYDADGSQIPGLYHPLIFAFGFQNPHNRLIEGISSVDIQTFRGEDSQAFFTPGEDGTYYLELGNLDFSSTGTYTVGVTEIEDDFLRTVDTTGTVEIGGTATGEIQYPNDRDWFAVELTAGVTHKVGLSGADDNGGTLPEPWIRGIHDVNGNQVSDTTYYASDPSSNSELIFRPTEDGTYYVAAGSYMSGNREEEIGTYTLQVSIDDTRDPTGTSDDLAADTSTIGRVAVGGSAFGEIGTASDRDWFAVELEAGETYRINTDGRQSGGGTLPRGRLYNIYDADGDVVPGVDDEPITWRPIHYLSPQEVRNLDGLAFFTPDEDGTHYLEVGSGYFEAAFGGSIDTGTYTVSVAEMEDDYSASTDTTGTMEVGGTATGESQYEIDRDWFAVELTAGETYKVELLGAHAKGGTLPHPYIWGIHDANGDLVSGTSDYASGPHSDSQVFFTPDEDGTYYVAAGNHESGSLASAVGTYTLQVSVDDFTDDIHTTGTLEVGGSVTGEIEAQGDRDWFAVTLEAGKTYQVDMEGSATDGGTLDNPTLYSLRDANGNMLHGIGGFDRDSGEGLNSRATFTVDEDGTYFVMALSGGHMHAADSHGRSIGTYTLSLQEVVDEVLAFGQQGYAFDLAENTDGSTDRVSLGTVSATDPEGATLSYSLIGGNESGSFEIDAASGEVFYTGGGEDYESGATQFALTVRASDGDQTTDADVTVNITDMDEVPAFGQQGYTFDLTENTDGSTDRVSLGTVSATDPEGATLSYSLIGGNESGSFEIDAASGEVFYTGGGEDYEPGATQFALTVRASDGNQATDADVTVNITDMDEVPAFGQQGYTFDLTENMDGSTDRVSLGTVSATDPEGATLSYSLVGGNESGSFEIDAASGELFYTGGGEDYESETTSYILTVRASDGSQTTDATATVNVTDVDEVPVADTAEADLPDAVSTTGAIAVGGSVRGEIGSNGDKDSYAVELVAGVTYRIDLEGAETGQGTLEDPLLRWLRDASGNGIRGTRDDNGGEGLNARQEYTPEQSGTYYVSATGVGDGTGTYTLMVEELDTI